MDISEVFSPDEIARAAGVPETVVLEHIASGDIPTVGLEGPYVSWHDAVLAGRRLTGLDATSATPRRTIFDTHVSPTRSSGVPLLVSSVFHAGLVAAIFLMTSLGLVPRAEPARITTLDPEKLRLVFLSIPGPGGGGGGGGLLRKLAPPKAERKGTRKLNSPLPVRRPPPPVVAIPKPPPEPPKPAVVEAEKLPPVMAPIVTAPADVRDRAGELKQTPAIQDSRGSGKGGGVGSGSGTGIGEGDGAGVGPGSGGGTGGGPYRPGSGIEPPRLLREVKPDYTEEARRRSLEGDVVLEIVVRRDGSVGDVRVLQGLGAGLDQRAIDAVRQWRFAPARRQNAPVDVIVEVAVEFKLR